MRKKVLFICTHNSARSQIAEGLLNYLYGDKYEAFSAGTQPTQVHPYAIKVMQEIGIDISHHYSKSIQEFVNKEFDYVVTVCDSANETCPIFSNSKIRIHKSFENPVNFTGSEAEILNNFRKVRDEIKEWIVEFFGRFS
ncbi:MAG: arsenate reductase ArsC [candidate division WOR-3 bacterium]|nr:arsenate reductase ArsC [candidate division WOR-3 bacterium]MCX7757169.1 arsenate reductase ArsC [candidate division WOR-3 bacterium]MDW7987980.1 arsenate reductase ArsC [candidate division WOR-3 bacterium]